MRASRAHKLVFYFLLVGFSLHLSDSAKLGKLECSETEGLKPDSTLLNLIISKCQPKNGHNETMQAACLIKCLMKQQKAVDKKGKLKVNKAKEVTSVFPDKFKDKVTLRFQNCFKENNSKLRKEPNGCDSWVPFTECFYKYGRELCPNQQEREEMAKRCNTTTTEVPTSSNGTTTTATATTTVETSTS